MATLNIAGWAIAPHESQLRKYNPDASYVLEDEGCVPTGGANGMNTVTGRRWDGDDVRRLIPKSQETDPSTPGWSLIDLDRAMAKVGVGFEIRTGRGRIGVRAAWAAGLAVGIQGDSEEFSNSTCSGVFNGDHFLVAFPPRRYIYGVWHRWVADSLCPTGRWERESEIWQYAENLSQGIRYGVWTKPVTKVAIPPPGTSVATHRALFARGADVRVYQISSRGTILKNSAGGYGTIDEWNNPASSAPCTAPIRRKTADGQSSALTVTVLKGYYVRDVIAANSAGVDIKEV